MFMVNNAIASKHISQNKELYMYRSNFGGGLADYRDLMYV
jgi:hypothetical protein